MHRINAKAMGSKFHIGFAVLVVGLLLVNPIAVCAATKAPAHPCCPVPQPVMTDCAGCLCAGAEPVSYKVLLSEDFAGVTPEEEVELVPQGATVPLVESWVAQGPLFLLFHQLLV
ncbi:MAG: hypothetical protein JST93_19500 [Acidobacteria bacterium]|nr:hypothetical protein [Acidobacteriota bacterium]